MFQPRQSHAPARSPRVLGALACLLACLLAAPVGASAHAELLRTVPQASATLASQPPLVIFEFNEPVGFTRGAVRVYDARGDEVDNSDVAHPGGVGSKLGVGLDPGLPDGTYTATYGVISADTHPVTGGLVFDIGHPSPSSLSLESLIARDKAGPITTIAFSVVRGLDYVALALVIGGLAFVWLVWGRVIDVPEEASYALWRRIERLLACGVGLGILTGEFGLLLEGASAAGVSLWSSVHSETLGSVLHTRFGWVWGSRTIIWVVLGGLLAATAGARRAGEHRADAEGDLGIRLPPVWVRGLAGLLCLYLAMTPGLSSHPAVQAPVGILLPADILHVVAVAIWTGGVATLLLVMPVAVRRLEPTDRTPLLIAVLTRFSVLALVCVIAITLTGGIQALVLVGNAHGLVATAYGRAILFKIVLFGVLVGFGALHRLRIMPALDGLVRAGATPGRFGTLLRRTLRREGLTMVGVFGATAALVAYTPPVDASPGRFSTTITIGPARLELTVDPARVGPNRIQIDLVDPKSGARFNRTVELQVTASLPERRIGPLALRPNPSGPGRYTLATATFAPSGTWRLEITDRVSAFDEYVRTIDVPIH